LKKELADTEQQHKDTVMRMERKFFEEKIRLQKEANRKISELASKAHKVVAFTY
jgi:rubrerythrin